MRVKLFMISPFCATSYPSFEAIPFDIYLSFLLTLINDQSFCGTSYHLFLSAELHPIVTHTLFWTFSHVYYNLSLSQFTTHYIHSFILLTSFTLSLYVSPSLFPYSCNFYQPMLLVPISLYKVSLVCCCWSFLPYSYLLSILSPLLII